RRARWVPCLGGERAELDVAGARQMPGGILAGLPDVNDRGCLNLPGTEQRRDGDRVPCGAPGRDASGQRACKAGVSDLQRLPDQVVQVLAGPGNDDERAV